ncbi:WD40-repeat-containing domain protein [Syncephalis pseudoplumigaleata]|uniref:WD40-repeat-containing domain protein n=1 Tax=Syncephalis pseudoplumigaleata TaxID=1712513 RepID=A0A4P9YZ21_9FUNG|nr:WD40-repeat-containing domain protein [Syncephalis pseudoplumigaleata]|eukprot:RKP25195.1 WD40-repeat-containing domain protein [Syncephalis pseudoplumigaleata]
MIHDAQLDYYGKRLATCSSDRTIRIFDVDADGNQRLVDVLKGHEGPVWQVSWGHPKFGTILASCSYDGRVIIWKESEGSWNKIKEHAFHTASVNSVSWAPHELGPILACASSDGRVSVLSFKDDGSWDTVSFDAHAIGCNAVTWSSAVTPGALVAAATTTSDASFIKRLATAGCDNLVKLWKFNDVSKAWELEETLDGHQDWVRDVAFAPSIGLPKTYLASCSQDKSVLIWTQETPGTGWQKVSLRAERFPDVVWRVSWSLSGNVLAVSSGDNKITLWKESLKGEWECISEMEEKHM